MVAKEAAATAPTISFLLRLLRATGRAVKVVVYERVVWEEARRQILASILGEGKEGSGKRKKFFRACAALKKKIEGRAGCQSCDSHPDQSSDQGASMNVPFLVIIMHRNDVYGLLALI